MICRLKYGFFYVAVIVVTCLTASSFILLQTTPVLIRFTVLPESQMNVNGKTNVKDFIFHSSHAFGNSQTGIAFNATHTQVEFEDAVISMDIASMNCGMKAMNADMAHTLKADQFPYITIRVLNARAISGATLNLHDGADLLVHVQISMAGQTHADALQCFARQLDETTFQFTGAHSLQLTDYGVQPPTALFGLVHVEDSITVKYNLVISTKNEAD